MFEHEMAHVISVSPGLNGFNVSRSIPNNSALIKRLDVWMMYVFSCPVYVENKKN